MSGETEIDPEMRPFAQLVPGGKGAANLLLPEADREQFRQLESLLEVPEGLALLQETLRDNSSGLVDADEEVIQRDNSVATFDVTRDRLTRSEQTSEGWAQLALREGYDAYDKDLQGGHYGGTSGVNYFYDTEEQTKSRRGGHQKLGREDLAIRLVDGKFVRADESLLDTSDAGAVSQAFNLRKVEISREIDTV